MNNDNEQLPVFPATAPDIFTDAPATKALFAPVFEQLAKVVEIPDDQLHKPTPCHAYTVADLRRHVLAWLQFFAAALNDPNGQTERLDPDTWTLGPHQRPAEIVRQAATDIARVIDGGVANELVVMSQARMSGAGVLAMALGEYVTHGWDLAVATGQTWRAADDAAEPALAFLHATVAPEYRGPDSGFFDDEVTAPGDASAFERLLCFAGRHPNWTPTDQ